MTAVTPLERAIENALEQVRAELIRFYTDGDTGKIEIHCGPQQLRVKATPERVNEPVRLHSKQ